MHNQLLLLIQGGPEALLLMQNPYQTNLMLAGYDEKVGPSLYLIDYLGSMHSMNMAGTGYGKHFNILQKCLLQKPLHLCIDLAEIFLVTQHTGMHARRGADM